MRAALYARYSSERQNERSIEDQLTVCRRHAASRGWTVVASFHDAAISGSAMANRPGLHGVLTLAEASVVDVVLVEDEDRLARNLEHLAHIASRLAFAGVRLATLTTDQVEEMHVAFKGLQASQFLKNLGAKTRRGMNSNFEKGLATSGRLYGYRTRPGGEISIEENEAAVVRQIFDLYAAGFQGRDIADRLNSQGIPAPRGGAWNASTINGNKGRANGILRTELYIGVKVYNRVEKRIDPRTGKHVDRTKPAEEWRRLAVPHLRIVSDDAWRAAQGRRRDCSPKGGGKRLGRRATGVFSGLYKCGICGSSYTAYGAGRLRCVGLTERGRSYCGNARSVSRAEMDERVLKGIKTRLLRPKAVEAYVRAFHRAWAAERARNQSQSLQNEKRLAEIRRRSARIIEAIETGVATADMKARLMEMDAERQALDSALDALKAATPAIDLHPGAIDHYRRQIENLEAAIAQAGDDPAALAAVAQGELAAPIRNLIVKIEIIPSSDEQGAPVALTLHGQMANFLKPADGPPQPMAAWGRSMVAGGNVTQSPPPLLFRVRLAA